MIKLLPRSVLISILVVLVLSASATINWAFDLLTHSDLNSLQHVRAVSGLVGVLVSLFLLVRPVWRAIWRIPLAGAYLSAKLVPDLNGLWCLTVDSNYPVMEARERAASRSRKLKPDELPGLSKHEVYGRLKQDWLGSSLTLYGHDGSVIDYSDTQLFEFSRVRKDQFRSLYWFFRQRNSTVADSDDLEFEGAAELSIRDSNSLSGLMWTNRSWQRGLNTAGPVSMKRKMVEPLRGWKDESVRELVVDMYKERGNSTPIRNS